MTKESHKLKLLYLMQIFFEETDESHSLTMPEIIEALETYGVSAERKALYRDIERLREFGLDIEKRHTKPTSYGLANRAFSSTELMFLADAVQSSRFLTKGKSEALTRSIKQLGSRHQVKDLTRRLHVEGRIRTQNESVYHNIDRIQQAIKAKRKVEFYYFKYDENKQRILQHGGDVYVETPVQLIYVDDNYYLMVFNDKHDDFAAYRVDRMCDLKTSDQKATRNERIANFDVTEYEARAFGMFSGETVLATLLVNADIMSSVVDRFGPDVNVTPADEAGKSHVNVHVMQAPTFYGWLAQFGTQIHIEKPASLAKGYAAYLKEIAETYT